LFSGSIINNMTILGIDPALRKNGLAVAIADNETMTIRSYRFRSFLDFHKWTLGHDVVCVGNVLSPDFTAKFAMVEDSNLDNATFKGRASRRQKYGAISRDAGKNMAVSSLIIEALQNAGVEVCALAPSQKTIVGMSVLKGAFKELGYEFNGTKNHDENKDETQALNFLLKQLLL